jgi:hypothetical protein
MSPRVVYCFLAGACLSVSDAAAASAPRPRPRPRPAAVTAAPTPAPGLRITHDAVGCMVAERYPQLTARFAPGGRLARARVYFQAEGSAHWYHVEMAADGEGHSAVLPKPKKGTARVVYYVEAADKALAESRTKDHAARVAAECGSDAAAAVAVPAAPIALGVPSGAPAIPAGFSADGLAGAAAAGGGGVPTTVLAGGGAAVAVGAVVLVAGGGGCEDKGVELAVTFGFNGTVACTQRNTAQQTYRVTNNTCAPITVTGLSGTSSSTGATCFPRSNTAALTLNGTTTIAAGETAVVRTGAAAGAAAPLCCPVAVCSAETCNVADSYTVTTSGGTSSVSHSFSFTTTGTDCPSCSAFVVAAGAGATQGAGATAPTCIEAYQ